MKHIVMFLFNQVSSLDPADVKLLAPVMASPVLRQLLISLHNDTATGAANSSSSSSGGSHLKSWVSNPRVVQLLRQAAKALRQGALTEQQLAGLLQQQHKVCEVLQLVSKRLSPCNWPLYMHHDIV